MCPSLGWWCDLLSYSALNLNEASSEQPLPITAEEKVTHEPATHTQTLVRCQIGGHHDYGPTIPDIICDILMHLFNWVPHFTRVSYSSVYMALGHSKIKSGIVHNSGFCKLKLERDRITVLCCDCMYYVLQLVQDGLLRSTKNIFSSDDDLIVWHMQLWAGFGFCHYTVDYKN